MLVFVPEQLCRIVVMEPGMMIPALTPITPKKLIIYLIKATLIISEITFIVTAIRVFILYDVTDLRKVYTGVFICFAIFTEFDK